MITRENLKEGSKRYLFFDIESSIGSNGHICEFGYVVTDEKLNIIEKRNILMNPKGEFSWRVLRKILRYSKYVYEMQKSLPSYYEHIKDLFNNSDMVFGFATANDAKYLNEDCNRFNLKYINYKFYDIQKILWEFDKGRYERGLDNALKCYHIDKIGISHDALDDAINSMNILKYIVEALDLSVEDLLSLVKNDLDQTNEGIIESLEINRLVKEERKRLILTKSTSITKKNRSIFNNYVEYKNANAINNISDNALYYKSVSISLNYEESHFSEMFNIVNILSSVGAIYETKSSNADVFIKDPLDKKCSRLKYVIEANENKDNKIQILEFEDFLKLLNISNDELKQMEIPDDVSESMINHDDETVTLGDIYGDFFKEVGLCF